MNNSTSMKTFSKDQGFEPAQFEQLQFQFSSKGTPQVSCNHRNMGLLLQLFQQELKKNAKLAEKIKEMETSFAKKEKPPQKPKKPILFQAPVKVTTSTHSSRFGQSGKRKIATNLLKKDGFFNIKLN